MTIGVLTNHIGGPLRPYERDMAGSISETAARLDCRVIFYSGGFYKSSFQHDNQRNFVYDLVTGDRPDGLIVISSMLGEFIGPEEISVLCRRLEGIPLLSAGMMIRGVPCVAIDNYNGMRQAVTHVVADHGARRVVYINGPTANAEAWDRLKAYTDVMKENGINIDPDYILQGDYYITSGRQAAKTLLDSQTIPFDAVVSANDEMAFGFMEYMTEQGIRCPEDYIITGFDNIEQSGLVTPTLTTVEQNTWDMGRRACELLCKKLNGEDIPGETWLATRLVVRDSCGCREPVTESPDITRSELKGLRRRNLQEERQDAVLQDISQELIHTTSLEQLRDLFDREFPLLEIQACHLCTINPAKTADGIALGLSYRRGSGTVLYPEPVIFPTTEIDTGKPGPFRVIEALNFRNEVMGILVFEVNRILFSLFSPLREQISHTLKNINTFSQIEELNTSLRHKLDHLTSLRKIDIAITESRTSHELLAVLLDQVIIRQKVDAAAILLYNPPSGTLEFAAGQGFRTEFLQHTRLRLGEGFAGKSAQSLTQIFIEDLRESGKFTEIPLFRTEEFVAYCAAPLTAHGELKGVLELFHRTPLTVDREWHDFLEALAGQAAIALDNTSLVEGLKTANRDLVEAWNSTIEGWSRALDMRDHETEGHCLRVAQMSVELGRDLGLGEKDLEHLYRGALLHDIGKVAIPDAILLKPGPLTDDERKIMIRHPGYAHELLSPIRFLHPSLTIPWCHHERWDGTGYPRGLTGKNIPLFARIFTVIDVWDALTHERPYRGPWTEEKVKEHIISLSGSHFDPEIVEAFMTCFTAPKNP